MYPNLTIKSVSLFYPHLLEANMMNKLYSHVLQLDICVLTI